MSEVKRYTFAGAAGFYVYQADYEAALARIADLTAQRDAILLQARIWSGEARAQRGTVNEVGSILGGIPDWGPIAAKVGSLIERLNTADQRNADALDLVRRMVAGGNDEEWQALVAKGRGFIANGYVTGGPIESGDESEVDLSGLYAGSKL